MRQESSSPEVVCSPAEALLEAQRRSLELVAGGAPLEEILSFLTKVVEEQSGGRTVASVLLLDEGGLLRVGAGASLPEYYNRAIDGLRARADLGTCSVAAVTGEVVVTPDIGADPKWCSIKHLPLELGLVAAWSQPILARDGRVLGTFGTYFRECRGPTEIERRAVEVLSRTAGIAIERTRADAERERLLAREREARAEADAANRAKDMFLAALSHELRTPLSPVVMTIPAIEADPDLPAKFREELAMVRRNIDLEVKLIDDLLDLSRIRSGKLRLDLQPVRLHEVVRQAIGTSGHDSPDKHVRVRCELNATNDRVNGDPSRLQQVFWNLVRNAVKFTPAGGRDVVVRTWNAEGSGELCVEVSDAGVGIGSDILPRIFDAFEQGDTQVARQFGGLGLGLAIAKAVVEMHGGKINAASAGRDQGAVFTVAMRALAVEAETEDRTSAGVAVTRRAGGCRVLLVEDHPDTARVLGRLLSLSGYEVETARSVTAALAMAEGGAFDLVLSDIGLPDATGYDLMKEISQRHGIPGIALTGYGMEEDLKRSREAGFAAHVVKPVNVVRLQEVMKQVMGDGAASGV